MPADVPLLNDYKKSFVKKRMLQTFLGGLQLAKGPWWITIPQILFFFVPSLTSIHFTLVLKDYKDARFLPDQGKYEQWR